MEISDKIIFCLAMSIAKRISIKVERELKGMKEGLQSGDDSGLENVWDEICVQIQYEYSVLRDIYHDTVLGIIEAHVEQLEPHEKTALWLQTDEGVDWEIEAKGKDVDFLYCSTDIAEYIAQKFLYDRATSYSNKKIERYIYG